MQNWAKHTGFNENDIMNFRYYIKEVYGRWREVPYSVYRTFKGEKTKSPCNILKELNKNYTKDTVVVLVPRQK